MSHDAEMDAAMARIGVLRYRLDEAEAELTDLKSTADRFEVENSILMKETSRLLAENERLKAEVERLESDLKVEKENEDRLVRLWQMALNEVHGQRSQIAALIDNQIRLKAEVERLKSTSTNADKFLISGLNVEVKLLQAEVEALMTNPTSRLLRAEREANANLKAEIEHLTSENLLVRGEADRYCRLWQEAKEGKQS